MQEIHRTPPTHRRQAHLLANGDANHRQPARHNPHLPIRRQIQRRGTLEVEDKLVVSSQFSQRLDQMDGIGTKPTRLGMGYGAAVNGDSQGLTPVPGGITCPAIPPTNVDMYSFAPPTGAIGDCQYWQRRGEARRPVAAGA